MKFSKDEKGHSNKFYRQLYSVWNHMKQRCENVDSERYKSYGAKGVTICEKWEDFDGFADDADSIDGWDYNLFIEHKIQLDKDYKVDGNKVYSPEMCMWISKYKNTQWRPNLMRHMVIQDPKGNLYYERNQSKIVRDYPLNHDNLKKMLSGKMKVAKNDWQVRYLEDKDTFVPYDAIHEHIIVVTPENKILECISNKDVVEKTGIDLSSVQKYMGKHNTQKYVKGYQLWYKSDFSKDKVIDPSEFRVNLGKLVGITVYKRSTNELLYSGDVNGYLNKFNKKLKGVLCYVSADRNDTKWKSKTYRFVGIYK